MDKLQSLVASCIGEGAAAQFISFIKIYKNLPVIEKVLNGGVVQFEKVKDLNVGYALTCALAFGVKKQEQVPRVWEFVKQYIAHKGMDFLVLLAKILMKKGFYVSEYINELDIKKIDSGD
jgi:hypothetical protein